MAFKMKGHVLPGIKQRQASPVKGFKIKPKKKTYTKKAETGPTGKYTKKAGTLSSPDSVVKDSPEMRKRKSDRMKQRLKEAGFDKMVMGKAKASPAKQKPVKKAGELTKEQLRKKSNKAMKESLKPKARDPKKDKGGLKVNKKGSPAKYDYKDYKTPKKETKQRGGYNRKGQKVDAKGNVIKRDPSKDKGGLKKKSPAKKPLVGKQKNLPEAIKKKILASPAKNYKNPQDYKVFNMGNPVKKYKSAAQRKAVHASKAEKSPTKMYGKKKK